MEKITISHEDLAKMIGSSRQSVTGILKGWEREGWLVQSYGHIELLLPEKLLAFNQRIECRPADRPQIPSAGTLYRLARVVDLVTRNGGPGGC